MAAISSVGFSDLFAHCVLCGHCSEPQYLPLQPLRSPRWTLLVLAAFPFRGDEVDHPVVRRIAHQRQRLATARDQIDLLAQ